MRELIIELVGILCSLVVMILYSALVVASEADEAEEEYRRKRAEEHES